MELPRYRVIYVTKVEETVFVLQAFIKKSKETSKEDIELTNERLRDLLNK